MAIITAEYWSEWANIPLTNPAELASVRKICDQVGEAIKAKLKRTIEQQTFTNLIVNAPDTPNIILTRYAPITISGFQCYYNPRANGNPAAFTSNNLLQMYTDYALDVDPSNPSLSPGNLQRTGNIWGISYRRRPNQLAFQFDPNFGAVKLTFQGGYATVPSDIVLGACLVVSMTLANRRYGFMVGSEGWNGYHYNIPGVGLMIHGLMGNPDVESLLNPYMNHADIIG